MSRHSPPTVDEFFLFEGGSGVVSLLLVSPRRESTTRSVVQLSKNPNTFEGYALKPSPPNDEIQEIRNIVRSAGLRCTSARLAVMQQLRKATSPVSHADIADDLVPLGFDKATVYRNLIDLADCGLVSRSELGDHVWRFELRDPNAPEDSEHPHFVCVDCGGVTCLEDVEMTPATRKRWEKVGRVTEILLKGHCNACD